LFWVARDLNLRGPVASERIREAVRAKAKRQIDGSKGPCGAATAIILPLDMTNHLALIKNERRHEYRRRLIAVEKSVVRCSGGDPHPKYHIRLPASFGN